MNPIKSLIGGGSVKGRFDLHPQGESAALEMEIDKLVLGPMMRKLGVERTLKAAEKGMKVSPKKGSGFLQVSVDSENKFTF